MVVECVLQHLAAPSVNSLTDCAIRLQCMPALPMTQNQKSPAHICESWKHLRQGLACRIPLISWQGMTGEAAATSMHPGICQLQRLSLHAHPATSWMQIALGHRPWWLARSCSHCSSPAAFQNAHLLELQGSLDAAGTPVSKGGSCTKRNICKDTGDA